MPAHRIGKYACAEIERRYLLRTLPAGLDSQAPYCRITDHYLLPTRLRLRRMDRNGAVTWKLAQKFRSAEQSCVETTITNLVLNKSEYDLLGRLGGRAVVKDRYVHRYDGRDYAIDVFDGELRALILAEVECETSAVAATTPCPAFAAIDVTDDAAFEGARLATLSRAGLRTLLHDRLGL